MNNENPLQEPENGAPRSPAQDINHDQAADGTRQNGIRQAIQKLIPVYWEVHKILTGCLQIGWLARWSLLLSFASFPVLLIAQSQEALRVLGQDAAQHPQRPYLTVGALLLLSFMSWYWARILITRFAPEAMSHKVIGEPALHLPIIAAGVPWLALAFALHKAVSIPDAPLQLTQAFNAYAIGSTVFAVIGYALLCARDIRAEVPRAITNIPSPLGVNTLAGRSPIILTGSFILYLLCFAIALFKSSWTTWIGPVALMLFCIALLVPVGSLFIYYSQKVRLPLISLGIALALLFSYFDWNDNHRIRTEPTKRNPIPLEFDLAFSEWLESRADKNEYDPYPVFIVSAQGGGLRAAYHTALVLTALQDRCPGFAQHTFAISGVSGGSLGAAVFAGLAKRNASNAPNQPVDVSLKSPTLQEQADQVLKQDFLSPVLAAGLFPDLLQQFLFFPVERFDRAQALETSFEEAWTQATKGSEFSEPFDDLWGKNDKDFVKGATPALFLNTTQVENGNRVVISNLYPLDQRVRHLYVKDRFTTMRLSTAVGISARFPGVTPAGYLVKGTEKYRLADGGYYENGGAETLLDILTAMRVGEKGLCGQKRRPFYPVLIRITFVPKTIAAPQSQSSTAATQSNGVKRPLRNRYRGQGLNELLSPFRTLYNSRDAHGEIALGRVESAVETLLDRGVEFQSLEMANTRSIELQLREETVPLPLGWMLSTTACREMKDQMLPPIQSDSWSNDDPTFARIQMGEVIKILAAKSLMKPPQRKPARTH